MNFQTPHKDISRSSDLTNRKKKSQKIPKENLNGLVTSVPSDFSSFSQITEISASSSETFRPVDTPISKVTSVTDADVAVERFESNTVEADVLVHVLKEALTEKVLDALSELVINDYNSCTGERDPCTDFVSMKIRVVVVCLVLWCVAALGILLFSKGGNESYAGLVPT